MNPVPGKILSAETNSHIEVSSETASNYNYTGKTEKVGSIRCAVFKDANGKQYYQPWNDWRLYKRGENNISAKLTTRQVRNMVKAYHVSKKTVEELAKHYSIEERTVISIVSGQSWKHVTVGLIQQYKVGNVNVIEKAIVVTNSPKRKTKISAAIAKFIVRDYYLNNIKINVLTTKYCLSKSSIRRVLSGKAWKETTIPAIQEYKQWTK